MTLYRALALAALPLALAACAGKKVDTSDYQVLKAGFDLERAMVSGPEQFEPFAVPDAGVPLAGLGLDDDVQLMVAERGDERRALLVREMSYHHIAQGELAGEPYLVAF